jgi:nitric oxide reductase subunit B
MKRLWLFFGGVLLFSFVILGWIGVRIYEEAPPIAASVVTTKGEVVVPAGDIQTGQNVWQSLGGMEVGSIWGHGSYVAPDWSADWLHREAMFILEHWSQADYQTDYAELNAEQQAQLIGRLTQLMRANTYDPSTGTITIDPLRAEAFRANVAHYSDVFATDAGAATGRQSTSWISTVCRPRKSLMTGR